MKDFLRFFYSKSFLINVLGAVVVIFIIIKMFFGYINTYTEHGDESIIDIPNFAMVHINDLDRFAELNEVRYEIMDTVHLNNRKKGIVISQKPEAFIIDPVSGEKTPRKVKKGRKVYLTVNGLVPPQVQIPKWEGLDLPIVKQKFASKGIKIIKVIPVRNKFPVVLDVKYKGKTINAGEKIRENSAVVVYVGLGKKKNMMIVPNVIDKSFGQAKNILANKSLFVGTITGCEECLTRMDTLNATVIDQFPVSSAETPVVRGSRVNLTLSN